MDVNELSRFKPRFLLVHYDEIALKGKNRGFFEQTLADSVARVLGSSETRHIKRLYGRLLVEFQSSFDPWIVGDRLQSLYGIAHYEPAVRVDLDLKSIQQTIWDIIAGMDVESFAVITRRANKKFPMNSMEVNRVVGRFVVDGTGWKVRIDRPQLPIYIYLLDKHAYIAFQRFDGPGGLPVGIAGKVVCLLSGGIDSPVAASRMMRRGCQPVFVHFHSAPYTSAASQDKVREIASHLVRHYRQTHLYLIPFADLQRRIVSDSPAPFRIILYRRFMIRAAEVVARREGARALVTGESLSQVSSQTLDNLTTIHQAASLPILRPLIAWDKLEIVREAEKIGTFETSIEPHDDCCSFLMPQHPATHSTLEEILVAERPFDVGEEVDLLLKQAEVVDLGGSQSRSPGVRGGVHEYGDVPGAPGRCGSRQTRKRGDTTERITD